MSELYDELLNDQMVEESFKVDTDVKADWALRKIAEINSESSRKINLCKEEISLLQEKMKQYGEKQDAEKQYFNGLLRDYFSTIDEKSLKTTKTQRSYELSFGKLKMKTLNPEFVRNDDVLLQSLKNNNLTDFIVTKESPKWAELKKKLMYSDGQAVTEDGEIIDGITVVEREPEFVVEVEI